MSLSKRSSVPSIKPGGRFSKFIQITKVDEVKREVGGVVTAEQPDKADEVCDYESSVPYYKKWSEEFSKATDGKSCGNLRVMHTLNVAGVGKQIEFQDDLKQIFMCFKVTKDEEWKQVVEGAYTGFSHGGEYVKTWIGADGLTHYTANPSEVSLVDNPCLGNAHFTFIRANGAAEMRKFATAANQEGNEDSKGGKKAMSIQFGKKAKKAVADATRLAVDAVIEKVAKVATGLGLTKDMYDVGRLGDILSTLAYLRMSAVYEAEREGDESTMPDRLQAELESLAEAFLSMAQEEVKELTESANAAGKGGMYMSVNATGLRKAASVKEHIEKMCKAHEAFHAKVAKLHKDRQEEHAGHIEKLHKILGSEEAGGEAAEEPESDNPMGEGAPSIKAAGGAMDMEKLLSAIDARMQDGIAKGVDSAMQALLTGIMGDERATAVLKTAGDNANAAASAAAAGLGNRAELELGKGPKVTMVRKVDDTSTTGNENKVAAPAEANIVKAAQGNDADILALMNGVTAQPVSKFVQGQLSKVAPS